MNIIIGSKGTPVKFPIKRILLIIFCWGLLIGVGLAIYFSIRPDPVPIEVPGVLVSNPSFSIIEEVALSYGIPPGPMERFSEYLKDNDFNDKYGGVGLFSVKPSHLGWLKDSVLADTKINLEDPIQNTQVAAFLLKRFHDSGYSWQNCFLIYTFGFSAVNDNSYSGFLDFVFDGE